MLITDQQKQTNYLSDEEYKSVFSHTPRLCVDLITVTNNGFLLTKRMIDPFKGLWHFPGGRVLYKEPINKAIKRIAKAEIGLEVENKGLVGIYEITEDGPFVHSITVVFFVKPIGGKIEGSWQGKEIAAYKEIPKEVHPYQKTFLEDHWKEIIDYADYRPTKMD